MLKTIALMAALLAVSPAAAQELSDAQLIRLASGHQFLGVDEMGETYWECFEPDHLLTGLFSNRRGLRHEIGAWAVQDDQLCMKWVSWRHGQERCAKIRPENRGYMWTTGYSAGRTFEVSACP